MTEPSKTPRTVEQRITDYLAGGGLFNPELANHDAVRDLLIDARDALSDVTAERERLIEALRFYAASSNYHLPVNFNPMRPVLVDGGERARQALQEAAK